MNKFNLNAKQSDYCFRHLLATTGVCAAALTAWSPIAIDTTAAQENEILLYGPIVDDMTAEFLSGVFGIDSVVSNGQFRKVLNEITGDVVVRINSPGGEVWEASGMIGALAERRAAGDKVQVVVDGLAASAATFPLMEADSVRATRMASLMIHRASAFAFGNSKDLSDTAKHLDGMDKTMAGQYAKLLDVSETEAIALLDAETWFTAEEAVKAGLVGEIVAAKDDDDKDGKGKGKSASNLTNRRSIKLAAFMGIPQ